MRVVCVGGVADGRRTEWDGRGDLVQVASEVTDVRDWRTGRVDHVRQWAEVYQPLSLPDRQVVLVPVGQPLVVTVGLLIERYWGPSEHPTSLVDRWNAEQDRAQLRTASPERRGV